MLKDYNLVIYKATNKINGKCYIGQTKNLGRRIRDHIRDKKSVISQAIRKYGVVNFKWCILEICFSQEELNEKEQWYIKHFNSFGESGYNLTIGGENPPLRCGTFEELYGDEKAKELKHNLKIRNKGKKVSEETKIKISEANKKYFKENTDSFLKRYSPITEETKKRMSEWQIGRKMSKETRNKMSETHKGDKNHFFGKHHTEESKNKIREAKKK